MTSQRPTQFLPAPQRRPDGRSVSRALGHDVVFINLTEARPGAVTTCATTTDRDLRGWFGCGWFAASRGPRSGRGWNACRDAGARRPSRRLGGLRAGEVRLEEDRSSTRPCRGRSPRPWDCPRASQYWPLRDNTIQHVKSRERDLAFSGPSHRCRRRRGRSTRQFGATRRCRGRRRPSGRSTS